MKRLFLIPLMMFTLALMSGQDIPPQVKEAAINATNSQIRSVYDNKPISPSVDAIIKLRDHIDTLNASNIIFQTKLHDEAMANDSITHLLLRISLQNDSLKTIVKTQGEDIDFMKKVPDYLMGFIMIIVGCLIALGMFEKYQEYRNETNNQKDAKK